MCSFPSCNRDFPADGRSFPRVLFVLKMKHQLGCLYVSLNSWVKNQIHVKQAQSISMRKPWEKIISVCVNYFLLKIKDVLKIC